MAISLSQDDYWALILESPANEHNAFTADRLNITWKYPSQLGHGFIREISLRDGLELTIADYQPYEDIITHSYKREHPLEYTFDIPDNNPSLTEAIPYHFYGSGIAPGGCRKQYANQRVRWVSLHIEPEAFRAFAGDSNGQVPDTLQHLIGDSNQDFYARSGQATPAMHIALQQILHSPYQRLTQRLFLESKVLELMVLILEHEVEAQQRKQPAVQLKPDEVDRLHWAKEILHQNLDNPPSLMQLARQVGLNECTLKRGFRQVFRTTVFGYLRQRRMEQAKALLTQGRMNVYEAARAVGYTSQSRFATAFRQTFGVNPKTFSTRQWQ
ncbi:MAG TPA: AraC family transcriptional regulator [Coleofasciculaceae cyanobacterium]